MEKLLYLSLWWSLISTGFLCITAYFMSCLLSYVSYNQPPSNFSLCLVKTLCQTFLSHNFFFSLTHRFILTPEKSVSGNSNIGNVRVKKKNFKKGKLNLNVITAKMKRWYILSERTDHIPGMCGLFSKESLHKS